MRLDIFDAGGRVVDRLVDGQRPAGAHLVRWDARRRPPGVYLCRLQCGGVRQSQAMALLR